MMEEDRNNREVPGGAEPDGEIFAAPDPESDDLPDMPPARLRSGGKRRDGLSRETKALLALVFLYALGCAVRIFLLRYASPNPYIAPDEPLYMNLARSLWNGEGVQLRGQPVTFRAILFSLMLSPLYALPAGSNIFGWGQIVETLVMNLAVFPAYALAKRFQCSRRVSLLVAVFSLLLPDLFMSSRWMTEALTYPLFLLSLLMCARFLDRTNLPRMGLAALSCFLLYLSKEGGAGIVVALVAVLVWRAVKEKNRDDLLFGIASAASFMLMWVLWMLLLRAIGVDFSTPSIYETQTQGLNLSHLLKTLLGMSIYALFTAIGFGVLPLLLPLTQGSRMAPRERWLLRLVLVALLVYVAGTCYVIYVDEVRTDAYVSRIHLRYLFPFIPVLLGALLSRPMKGARLNTPLAFSFSLFIALLLTYGLRAFGSRSNFCIDALLLSFLSYTPKLLNAEYTVQLVLLFGCGAAAWWLWKHGFEKRIASVFCVIFALQLIIANYTGYETNQYSVSKELAADARQISAMVADRSVMLVSDKQNGTFDSQLISLDGELTETPAFGLLHDVCREAGELADTKSLQLPPYWVAGESGRTRTLDTIVLNNSSLSTLRLADGVETQFSDNRYFAVVTLPESGYFLHSALCGLVDSTKVSSDSAFWLFDPDMLQYRYLRLKLTASASTADGSTLTAQYGDQTIERETGDSRTTLEYVFEIPGDGEPVEITLRSDTETQIFTYTVEGLSERP